MYRITFYQFVSRIEGEGELEPVRSIQILDRSVQKSFQTSKNRPDCHVIFNRLKELALKTTYVSFIFLLPFFGIFKKIHVIVVYVFKVSQK
jgi:hypothetical protein